MILPRIVTTQPRWNHGGRGVKLKSLLPSHRCGWLYVIGSIGCGIYYLTVAHTHFANDLWWAGYTSTGPQALLVDLVNANLAARSTGPLDILDTTAVTKAVGTMKTDVSPTYVWQLLFSELTTVDSAVAAVRATHVGLMQFATTSSSSSLTSWTVLTQPLVDDDTAWSFYGWLFVYDWVHGRRFVVSLEGDASTQVLVSAIAAPTLFPSTGGSGLTHATRVIYYLSVYMSAVLAVVAVASLVVHAVNRASTDAGDNWFFFNRVAGSIWVGRPLLVNRALSAMLILSTAQVALDGSTHFVFAPRPWIDTLVVAGETTWLAYVIVDACHVIVAPGHTKAYAPWGTALAWSIIVVIELAAPIQPVGALRRECTSTNMDMAIACSGSVVQVGNLARLATLMGMQLGSLVVAAVGVYFWNQRRRHSGLSTQRQRHVLAIADEFFAVRESPTDAIWAMDPVSCVVAGLVPFKLGGTRYTFDVKFWVVVPDTYSLGAMKRFVSNAREVKVKHRSSLLAPVGSFGPSHVSIRQAAATAAVAGGVLYTVAAIVGSILYIQVAKVNLANDLSWAKFSMAGTHTFLANLLNERLVLGIDDTRLALDDGRYAMVGGDTGASSTVVSPANFGARLAA
ncbi:hypothetical protein As57867_002868, partial [Aphanomyces stellatus]